MKPMYMKLAYCLPVMTLFLCYSESSGRDNPLEIAGKVIKYFFSYKPSAALVKVAGKHADNIPVAAKKLNIKPKVLSDFVIEHGKTLRKASFETDALEFAYRNQESGLYFIDRFYLPSDWFPGIKGTQWMKKSSNPAIKDAHRLAVEGKGWKIFQGKMTDCQLVGGTNRDICERIFYQQASAGKIPGISETAAKGMFPAKRTLTSRDGTDFLIAEKGQPLRWVEFGTGIKPKSPSPDLKPDQIQGSVEHVQKFLKDYLSDINNRINLLDKGCPKEIIDAALNNTLDSTLINKFIKREFHAVSLNQTQLEKIGAKGFELP
jgi:hypothetical protein